MATISRFICRSYKRKRRTKRGSPSKKKVAIDEEWQEVATEEREEGSYPPVVSPHHEKAPPSPTADDLEKPPTQTGHAPRDVTRSKSLPPDSAEKEGGEEERRCKTPPAVPDLSVKTSPLTKGREGVVPPPVRITRKELPTTEVSVHDLTREDKSKAEASSRGGRGGSRSRGRGKSRNRRGNPGAGKTSVTDRGGHRGGYRGNRGRGRGSSVTTPEPKTTLNADAPEFVYKPKDSHSPTAEEEARAKTSTRGGKRGHKGAL